jgi:hypothetical protein
MINQQLVKRRDAAALPTAQQITLKRVRPMISRIRTMLRPALCTALLLLAGCARSEDARNTQIDNVPLPSLNTSDLGEEDELSIGSWQTGVQDGLPVVEFGPVGAPGRFSFGCDARRNLILQLPGAAPGGDLPRMLVTIGSETRQLPLASAGNANPVLRATLPASDPFMRVLSVASARIFVRIGDSQPLVMPPSATIGVFIRQCANGEVQAAAPAPGNTVEATGTVNVVAANAATDADQAR